MYIIILSIIQVGFIRFPFLFHSQGNLIHKKKSAIPKYIYIPFRYILVSIGDDLVSSEAVPILDHAPTLNTVMMVESVLRNMDESVITVAELKRRLPRKVNHNKLKIVLRYLEESNKILFTTDGITWIFNPNPNLRIAISQGHEL